MSGENLENSIKDNLEKIKKDLVSTTKLIAVCKTFPTEYTKIAYKFNQFDFGENRVKDLLIKANELNTIEFKNLNWHFIGHLQSNKVKDLLKVPRLTAIHSVDSIDILNELIKHQDKLNSSVDIFLQINTSDEVEKSGFDFLDQKSIFEAVKICQDKKNKKFFLKGLMTIGKIRSDNFLEDAKICFNKLIDLQKQLNKEFNLKLELSMGMSHDYQIATKLGSNYVRIGTAIFGGR